MADFIAANKKLDKKITKGKTRGIIFSLLLGALLLAGAGKAAAQSNESNKGKFIAAKVVEVEREFLHMRIHLDADEDEDTVEYIIGLNVTNMLDKNLSEHLESISEVFSRIEGSRGLSPDKSDMMLLDVSKLGNIRRRELPKTIGPDAIKCVRTFGEYPPNQKWYYINQNGTFIAMGGHHDFPPYGLNDEERDYIQLLGYDQVQSTGYAYYKQDRKARLRFDASGNGYVDDVPMVYPLFGGDDITIKLDEIYGYGGNSR
jgi:hypothetical protein